MLNNSLLIKCCSQFLGIILFLFSAESLFAETLNNESPTGPWTLWAKPRICVVPSDHLTCKMVTDIYWLGSKTDNICLLSSEDNDILQCWTNASAGQIAQTINSDKQIIYWLSRKGKRKILVKTNIRIVKFPQKRIRRRRRHVWSLL